MKKKAIILASAALAACALPLVTLAGPINNVSDLGSFIIGIINNVLVPVIFALAFIVFIIGAFITFILGATKEEAKKKGSSLMIWSLVGFFVMITIWGLVNLLTNSVQFGNNSAPTTIPSAGVNVH